MQNPTTEEKTVCTHVKCPTCKLITDLPTWKNYQAYNKYYHEKEEEMIRYLRGRSANDQKIPCETMEFMIFLNGILNQFQLGSDDKVILCPTCYSVGIIPQNKETSYDCAITRETVIIPNDSFDKLRFELPPCNGYFNGEIKSIHDEGEIKSIPAELLKALITEYKKHNKEYNLEFMGINEIKKKLKENK